MTKTLLALSAALLCAQGIATAQASNTATAALKKNISNPATAPKTTATDSRMIAVTTRTVTNGNLDISDSAHCYYSPGFGYDHKLDEWKFNNATSWLYDGTGYAEYYHVKHTFDANNRITLAQYEVYDGTVWADEEIIWYTWDANGNNSFMKDAYFNGNDWDTTRNTFTYNAAGQVTSQLMEQWNQASNQWMNNMRTTTSYNAAGQVTTTVNEYWNTVSNQWENSYRTTNTYVNNLRTEALSEQYMMGSWQNSNLSLYTYDAAGNVLTEENKWWNSGVWQPTTLMTYTYNAANDRLTSERQSYVMGQYEYQDKTTSAYNGYHQAVIETEETWDDNTGQWQMKNGDNETRYYYEEYTNSVKDNKAAIGSISVFPVPARNVLHLRTNLASAQAADVALLDVSGRVVKQLHLPTAQQYSTTIDVANLPAGNYTLRLTAAGKQLVQKVVVQ